MEIQNTQNVIHFNKVKAILYKIDCLSTVATFDNTFCDIHQETAEADLLPREQKSQGGSC